jgi:hypothetical protein
MALRAGSGDWSQSLRAAVFGSVFAALIVIEPCAGQQNVTAPGGVAVGGNSAGTVNFGLTPEQLREVTKAAVEGETDLLLGRIEDISKRLGITEEAAKTLLKVVGEDPNVHDLRRRYQSLGRNRCANCRESCFRHISSRMSASPSPARTTAAG